MYNYPRKYKGKFKDTESDRFVKKLLAQHRRNNGLSRLLSQLEAALDNAARARNDLDEAITDISDVIHCIREYNGER
jgi:hypothetical protein